MADARTTQLPEQPTSEVVSRRTRILLRLLGVILLVMLGLLVVRVIQGALDVWPIVAGIAVGAAIGLVLGRMNRVRWDQSAGTVVSQMDLLGIALLVVYLVFTFTRGRIVGNWVHDAHTASAVALALGAGSIAGRILYLLHGIRNALIVAGLRPPRS